MAEGYRLVCFLINQKKST